MPLGLKDGGQRCQTSSMVRNLLTITLIALGFVIFSCLITMMVMFVSLSGGGSDQVAFLGLQAVVAPIALVIFAVDVSMRIASQGQREALRSLWHGIPAWLVLALVLVNSLVLIGELAHFVLRYFDDEGIRWIEHSPLVCILCCSLAFCTIYARTSQRAASIGRWSA